MKCDLPLFFVLSHKDPTLTATHISLYTALFILYVKNGWKNPVPISRKAVMTTARIKSGASYHKCINDLFSSGYLLYNPSHNYRTSCTTVTLL
jgi:hypothetical protein